MPTSASYLARARSYLGTPFRHQGRKPGMGLDCVGVLVCAGRAEGIEVTDTPNYRRHADWATFTAKFNENADWVGNSLDALEPGRIIILRDGKYQTHCAVIGTDPVDGAFTIVHAYEPRGKVVEERITEDWRSRIVGVYKLRGLD